MTPGPAGTQHQNDVVSTSMRRDHVASTLIRRHFNVVCPLGALFQIQPPSNYSNFGTYRIGKKPRLRRDSADSPEPSLLAYNNYEIRGTFMQRPTLLAQLDRCACTFEGCVYGMNTEITCDGSYEPRRRKNAISEVL